MFHGSIPASMQQILGGVVSDWNAKDIYIGCSGNFTIERMLQGLTNARLHGNDVTIYSCLLGSYFAGQPLNVRFRDSYDGPMAFVKDYMKTDADIISVMMQLSKMSIYLGSKRKNPYYEKMIEAHISQWDALFLKTKEKMQAIQPFLSSLHAGDVCKWIDTIPQEAAVICYPPFFSGDYEKMFRVIEEVFEWEPPTYDMIDKEKIMVLFRKMTAHDFFAFGTNDVLPEFEQHLIGVSQTTNRGVPLYIYGSSNRSRIVMPAQTCSPLLLERLGVDEDIGDVLQIFPMKSEQFHALRSQYMNAHIKPGSETASYAVAVDGKVVGAFAFSTSPTLSNWDTHIDTPTIYLLSDFPIAPSKYSRLAKLVLYAALSKESKLLAERLMRKRVRSLITTAFSKNPVSMKYRGLFALLSKKRIEDDSRYQLNYGAPMGQWTLQEGFAQWKQKHSRTEGRAET